VLTQRHRQFESFFLGSPHFLPGSVLRFPLHNKFIVRYFPFSTLFGYAYKPQFFGVTATHTIDMTTSVIRFLLLADAIVLPKLAQSALKQIGMLQAELCTDYDYAPHNLNLDRSLTYNLLDQVYAYMELYLDLVHEHFQADTPLMEVANEIAGAASGLRCLLDEVHKHLFFPGEDKYPEDQSRLRYVYNYSNKFADEQCGCRFFI
jgi:hypothetical protein